MPSCRTHFYRAACEPPATEKTKNDEFKPSPTWQVTVFSSLVLKPLLSKSQLGGKSLQKLNPAMHQIAVLALHGVITFALAIPCEVFGRASVSGMPQAYEVRVCGEAKDIKADAFDIRVP